MSCTRSLCLIVLPLAAALAGACSETNHAPILGAQSATTDEDTAIDVKVLDGARDPDGDALTVASATATGHRVEIIDQSIIRLTPMRDFHGTIQVDYEVRDGGGASALGHLIVTVRPVNDPPVATGGDRTLHGSHVVMLEGSDVDGDKLTFEVVANPKHGALTGNPPAMQYAPDGGFIGDDEIMYTASDGTATSQPARLALHVSPGAAPVAMAADAAGNEDQQLALTLHGSDADGDALTFTVVTEPKHGSLAGTPPNLTFTPDPDFNGDDAIEFTVGDSYFTSDKAAVAIHVLPVNDAPVATPQAIAAVEDTAIAITLAGTDIDGDPLVFQVKDAPANGTVSAVTGATLTYTPARDFHGTDHFTFTASDGKSTSSPATIDLSVAAVADPPVAMSFARTLNEDTANSITLVGSDGDADPLSFAIGRQPEHGALTGDAPNVTYTPNPDFNGDDSFTYTVSDGTATSDPGTVTLHVTPVNDRPVPVDGAVTTDEDTFVDFTLQASDIDSPTLTYSIVTQPADGVVQSTGGAGGAGRRYVPAHNANGTRSFTFRVSDGSLTADATVTITINPVNDPPVTTDDFTITDPDTALTYDVVANDSDIDGDAVALDSVDPTTNGTAAIVDGKLVYTPNAGFTGFELVGYTVSDGHGGTAHGTAHVGVGMFPPGAPTETIPGMGLTSFSASGADRKPSVSNDGRYIAFSTPNALVSDDTNAGSDVYLYDRGTRSLTLVSVDGTGHAVPGNSTAPQLSGNGRYIAFQSSANTLVAGDSNGKLDVFRYDRITREIVRLSVASGGAQGNNNSFDPAISDDGNLVAFWSIAFNLVASDANGAPDVFVRDVAAGTTERISVGTSGGDADLGSLDPVISSDGRFVAFTSSATNLVAGDGNAKDDIFVRDRVAATTTRISVSTNGGEANDSSRIAAMSRDGRFVSFLSAATNLVPNTSNALYVRDLQSLTTTRAPATSTSQQSGDLSGDGRFAVSFDFTGLLVSDRFGGTSVRPVGTANWLWPAISDNGNYIVALESANNARMFIISNGLNP